MCCFLKEKSGMSVIFQTLDQALAAQSIRMQCLVCQVEVGPVKEQAPALLG